MNNEAEYIGALDVGTTTLRFQILNPSTAVIGSSSTAIKLLYPKPGYFEINPDQLWQSVLQVIRDGLDDANLEPSQIKCLGISTQRCTFTTWRKSSGKPFHNFITWKDLRADSLVKEWNKCLMMKVLRSASYAAYLVSRNKRFLTASRLNLSNGLVLLRLMWVIQNVPELQKAIKDGDVAFGTVETWLLHKLTAGKIHVTDISNASVTGLFDPFLLEWTVVATHLFKIPKEILPRVVNNDYNFGSTDESVFGVRIPIKCVMADQTSSMFGSGCLNCGDLKVTLGTGSFLNLNTGSNIHTSVNGLYPVVGWRLNSEIVYLVEAACNDAGSLVQWALSVGLTETPEETHSQAANCEGNDGLYFIPAFGGLGPPINNEKAAAGFLGLRPTTKKEHMIRAILESIVFRIVLSFNVLKKERQDNFKKICIDGGVAKNDFICQLVADMTSLEVERPESTEMSILGVAFIAGLNSGIWKSKNDIVNLRKINTVFTPTKDMAYIKKYRCELENWLQAVERFKSWYDEKD